VVGDPARLVDPEDREHPPFVRVVRPVERPGGVVASHEERRQELAVRIALGAGSLRVARELLLESVLVGLLGGITDPELRLHRFGEHLNGQTPEEAAWTIALLWDRVADTDSYEP